MNPPTASTTPSQQFQALQQRLRQGEALEGLAEAQALLRQRLTPLQRALVLQLQADLLRGQGKPQEALALWDQSLQGRFAPAAALASLELLLLPAVDWDQRPRWLDLIRQLVEQGHGPALLRWLTQLLEHYPLDQQRQELLAAIESSGGLERADQPGLKVAWIRLQRLMARPMARPMAPPRR